jgi:hypothetical protein
MLQRGTDNAGIFDGIECLVPCKIITAYSELNRFDRFTHQNQFEIEFTATRGWAKKGERYVCNVSRVVPRSSARRHKYSTTIVPYSWAQEYAR